MVEKYGRSAAALAKVLSGNFQSWERARTRTGTTRSRAVCDFVTISRQVGSGGAKIVAQLGEKTGWPVFDREVLQAMAGDDTFRERLYAWMDERDTGWLEQMLKWVVAGRFPPQDYVSKLGRAILALARGAPGIFLGRAADLILPQDQGLRVRVNAPLEVRVRNFGLAHSLEEELAAEEVERLGRERADFIQNHFRRDVDDATRYDLAVNTGRVSVEEAVELIVATMRLRGFID